MPSPIHAIFKDHLATLGHSPEPADWKWVCELFEPVEAKRSDTLLDSAQVAGDIFFVCKGVAASFQTARDVGTRYRFLATRYATVIEQVPDRDLARFLGITPQGLSRFLRNNRGELT